MTDKEKIAQIIAEHLCSQGKSHKRLYGSERMCYSRDNFAECEKVSECVDALIAAGIGDTTNLIVEKEVLQRALRSLAQLCAKGAKYYLQSDKAVKERERELYNEWIKQAEKELAEERKDD